MADIPFEEDAWSAKTELTLGALVAHIVALAHALELHFARRSELEPLRCRLFALHFHG